MLFSYKGKPAAFYFTIDIHDEHEYQAKAVHLNSKWEFKSKIDKHLI
jgi:hypothetical protein